MIIFSTLSVILGLIILISTHFSFKLPDYYTNRDLAFEAAQISDRAKAIVEVAKYENKLHGIYNFLFQLFGWTLSCAIFSLIFKIKSFNKIKNLDLFRNRKFIFSWINLSYILYCFCWVSAYMLDLEKYVYNTYADSMGIPFFTTIFTLAMLAVIYYIGANSLYLIIFNTKIKSRFYSFILIMLMIYSLITTFAGSCLIFSFWHVGLNLFSITWIMLILTALQVLKEKRQIERQDY